MQKTLQKILKYAKNFINILDFKDKNKNENIDEDKVKPPILFIHGSYHSAWCFREHYLDYFSSLGHRCFAISLRGTMVTGK